MKNIFRTIAAGFLAAAMMMAQRGPRAAGGGPPDPATMVQHQVERLTTLLTLTTSQVSQATTIFTNSITATSALQSTQQTDRQALQAAIKSNAASTIDQLATVIGGISGQILAVQSKADAAFFAILTADQQAKLDQLGGGFGRRGFGPGPGGPPPGRP